MTRRVHVISQSLKRIADPNTGIIKGSPSSSMYLIQAASIIDIAVEALKEVAEGNGDKSTAEEALNRIRIICIK